MPLFKCTSSKSTPRKAISYITDPNKVEFVSVRNLFEDEEYSEYDLPTIFWCKTKEECVEHMKNYIYLFPYCEKDFRFMTLCSYEDFMKQ